MNSLLAKWKSRDFLVIMLFLQFILYGLVFFDVPVARQVIGFIYFTFVPGFVILKLLKLDKQLDGLEVVLFSVGLSVAFLMLAGLLINEFGFLLGISEPLSLMPLMIILNSFILIGGILACLRSEGVKLWEVKNFGLSPSALLLMGLPVLSVVGTMYVNAFGNNLILLFMIIAISLLFVIAIISKKLLPPRLYPFAVLMIAIALLYHSSLISNYLIVFGSDVPVEHFVFKITKDNAWWDSTNPYPWDMTHSRINVMLSVTILPTIYSSLLNMDTTWVFKALYPLIFSLVPLGLYQIWQTYIGKKYALISTFLFMAQETFYTEMLGLNRQMVSELFFVLLLLVIFSKKVKMFNKMLCFAFFSFALAMSHYGLSEIFLFFISLTLISLVVTKRPSRNITATMVVLFFVVTFSWYIYTSKSVVFDDILEYGNYVYSQIGGFFNPTSRQATVLRGLGLEKPPTIWNAVSRAFAYITEFLIVVGFVGLVTRARAKAKVNFDWEYFMFTSWAMGLLAMCILLPGFASTLNMTRFYHIVLFFLAPLCVLGAEVLVRFVSKRKTQVWASVLLLVVLTPYFLFQTSFVYEVTGSESWSISLSGYRMGPRLYTSFGVVTEQEVLGAQWLSQYASTDAESLRVHVDVYSRAALIIYGMIPRSSMSSLSNVTVVEANEIVYLGKVNSFYGMVIGMDVWNTTSITDSTLSGMSRIYSNGDCAIYENTINSNN